MRLSFDEFFRHVLLWNDGKIRQRYQSTAVLSLQWSIVNDESNLHNGNLKFYATFLGLNDPLCTRAKCCQQLSPAKAVDKLIMRGVSKTINRLLMKGAG